MHFGQATNHGFVQHWVVVHSKRRIFGEHLDQHFVEAAFVTTTCWFDSDTKHRLWKINWAHANVEFRFRVQDGTVLNVINFCESTNVARAQTICFSRCLTLQNQRVCSFHTLTIFINEEHGVFSNSPLMYAEDANLSDVGVVDDLKDLSNDRFIFVWRGWIGRAIRINKEGVISFFRTW